MKTEIDELAGEVPYNYTGTDNLEVMADAVNYNKYLVSLLTSHARADGGLTVDFGSGIGTFALAMGKHGIPVHCIEPDARQAAVIATNGLAVSPSLEQLGDASIDYLYTLNVLEHIDDDRAVLAQMQQKLKPGATLLIYVPAFQVLYSSMDRKVGHVRRYTRGDLVEKLRSAGFAISEARYVDSIGYFASLYFRFMGDASGDLNTGALRFYDRVLFPLSRVCDFLSLGSFGKNLLVVARK